MENVMFEVFWFENVCRYIPSAVRLEKTNCSFLFIEDCLAQSGRERRGNVGLERSRTSRTSHYWVRAQRHGG